MIAQLNLASQPFRNRTLPWIVTAFIACASLLALFLIFQQRNQAVAQGAVAERDVQNLNGQARALRQQAAQVRDALSSEERQVLEAAHAIVDRKTFSWSGLFADLEASVPADVRVTNISVRDVVKVGDQTFAELELSVVGQAPANVTRMVSEMNRAGVFTADLLTQNPRAGRGESGTEWTLRVRYTPRAGRSVSSGANENTAATGATGAASIASANGGKQ
ncbi:MAG: hypothetical protein H0V88_08125 [Pyrinomonadaceae bacterium]|nr:hypothetical protein [Pyrinomonadaceae bacterium]